MEIETKSVRARLRIEGGGHVYLVFRDEAEVGKTDALENVGELLTRASGKMIQRNEEY